MYSKLKRIIRRTSNLFRPSAVILLYHRVSDEGLDPQLLCVSRRNFAAQMAQLRKEYNVISLQELSDDIGRGIVPRGAVAVTFDDGYRDNLTCARPVAEEYGIPATVFVSTGYIGENREFWWDDLERAILSPAALPPSLRLEIAGKTYSRELGGAPGGEEGAKQPAGWNVLNKKPDSGRQRAYRELHALFLKLDADERFKALGDLCAWAGVPLSCRPDHLPLNEGEIRSLAEGGLIDIGSHGCSHSNLAAQSREVQAQEIAGSKRRLEDILGRPVTSFAYPFGGRHDITGDISALVKDSGYRSACINVPVSVRAGTDPFLLGRHIARDWGIEEFSSRLRGLFYE